MLGTVAATARAIWIDPAAGTRNVAEMLAGAMLS
jgi:hypothetical protein